MEVGLLCRLFSLPASPQKQSSLHRRCAFLLPVLASTGPCIPVSSFHGPRLLWTSWVQLLFTVSPWPPRSPGDRWGPSAWVQLCPSDPDKDTDHRFCSDNSAVDNAELFSNTHSSFSFLNEFHVCFCVWAAGLSVFLIFWDNIPDVVQSSQCSFSAPGAHPGSCVSGFTRHIPLISCNLWQFLHLSFSFDFHTLEEHWLLAFQNVPKFWCLSDVFS